MGGAAMYTERTPASAQSDLIEQHAALVKRIAYHMIARLPPTVDVEDLIQAGMIGLLDAAGQFNASQGASFETYAGIRIRGAMLDEIRRNDWAPRSVHKKAREIAEKIHEIEQEKGRTPNDQEIAAAMNLDINEYYQQLTESAGHQVFSLDEFSDNDESHAHPLSTPFEAPDEDVQNEGFQQALAKAIDSLPERERLMMSLYYNEELNLKEIGEVLGVSESRVSQIHSQTVIRLQSKLRDWIM